MHVRNKLTVIAIASVLTIFILLNNIGLHPSYYLNISVGYDRSQQLSLPHIDPNLRNHTKFIHLWTEFFTSSEWGSFFDSMPATIWYDSTRKCHITNSSYFRVDDADAVVFHGPDLKYDQIPYDMRQQSQRWVYFALESAYNLHFNDLGVTSLINAVEFNWTMSYSRESDIYYPYGQFIRAANTTERLSSVKQNIENLKIKFETKRHDAVWVVSNCRTVSKREYLAESLIDLGLDVHVIGKCGIDAFTKLSITDMDFSEYRFYFAFENTLCPDYVTEKAYHAFDAARRFGAIPIVYGAANYSSLLPKGSFIDAKSFESSKKLYEYLTNFTAEDMEEHLAWQYEYELDYDWHKEFTHFVSRIGWKNLCRRLWETGPNETSTVDDIVQPFGKCSRLPVEDNFGLSMETILFNNKKTVDELVSMFSGVKKAQVLPVNITNLVGRLLDKNDNDLIIQIIRNKYF